MVHDSCVMLLNCHLVKLDLHFVKLTVMWRKFDNNTFGYPAAMA